MGAISRKGGSDRAGDYRWCAVNTVPAGWLACDGSAVSRAAYPALFAAIGTTYGAGDGATTFNVPDMRGEFPRGDDAGRGVDSGRVFGSAQADEVKAHVHNVRWVTSNATNGASYNTGFGGGAYNNTGDLMEATGGSETRPRNVAGLFIIKY